MSDKNLEGRMNSDAYSGFKRTMLIGITTLVFLGALIIEPTSRTVGEDHKLKESTYTSTKLNKKYWADNNLKGGIYKSISETVKERKDFKEYLKSNEPYECSLPNNMTKNKFYSDWISNITRSEFRKYNPNLEGKTDLFVKTCLKEKVNPLLVLLMYKQESSYGIMGVATVTKSIGNERGIGPAGSYSGFASYHNMSEALNATVKNMERLMSLGYNSINKLIGKWAPSTENDTNVYIHSLIKGIQEKVNIEIEKTR